MFNNEHTQAQRQRLRTHHIKVVYPLRQEFKVCISRVGQLGDVEVEADAHEDA